MLGDDTATGVVRLFASRWWVVLLRGIIAIAFGVAAFAWPAVTVASLVLLFGWYAFIDGVFSLGTAIGGRRDREHRWWLVLEGIVGIWLGVVTLRAPAVTALMLVFFISIWAMTTGLLRIGAAFRLRKDISGELWLALSGVLSILFAFMLILRPGVGLLGLVWVVAIYALILGVFEILLGVELRAVRTA
jgi:uncharacterized membrane protein HdeD (DUF308 family)